MFGVVYHADEEHDRVWRARPEAGDTLDESLGGWCYEHSVDYIPGTGFLSPGYANVSKTRFTAALIEIKRRDKFGPGEKTEARRCLGGAVYVIDGSRVWERRGLDGEAEALAKVERASVTGHWYGAAGKFFWRISGTSRTATSVSSSNRTGFR